MKILIDSSTLYSAIAFPKTENEMVKLLLEKHTLVITRYIEEELERNFKESFSEGRKKDILFELDMFTSKCEIKELEDYQEYLDLAKEKISKKDAPILACAMLPDIDYLIASDKEFWRVDCEKAKVLSSKMARKILLSKL